MCHQKVTHTHRYFCLHLWNSSLMFSRSVCFHSVGKYCLAVFNDPWTWEGDPQFNMDYTHEYRHCKQPQSVLLYRLVCSLQILSAFTLPFVFVHSLVFLFLSFLPSFSPPFFIQFLFSFISYFPMYSLFASVFFCFLYFAWNLHWLIRFSQMALCHFLCAEGGTM